MTFNPEAFIQSFDTGEAVPVAEADLTAMEDVLVRTYLPPESTNRREAFKQTCEFNWQHRERLVDALRPKGFNGRLIDPYVQLVAPEAAFDTLLKRTANHSLGKNPDHNRANLLGIRVISDIASTRADMSGGISRPVWYVRTMVNSSTYNGGRLWVRHVGPNSAANTIDEAIKRSRNAAHGDRSNSGATTPHHRVANK